MEDTLSPKTINIKSSINNYSVKFADVIDSKLSDIALPGDIILVDENIHNLYDDLFVARSSSIHLIVIEANETQKSYQKIQDIIEQIIDRDFKRNNRLIAIGGGIIQDCTGFIASIIYRGVDWIFIPTSLLAQGDSCIGSKTSINFDIYKNMLGGFYPPKNILIDLSFLDSLSKNDIMSGLGEMLHYFIVSSKEDFEFYKDNYINAIENKEILSQIIYKSLLIKKDYIERDEFDKNERQVFNYGHTFGHAIESITEYQIPHGIAVSFGMDLANFISEQLGLISKDVTQEIREVTNVICNGFSIDDINLDDYLALLKKDKKNQDGMLGLILNNGFGNIKKIFTEPNEDFRGYLQDYFLK
ncbi:iron-containing alcohol dehydrogenase [Verrucomicrobia bacterium]|nr:iron-containing alcohol dehydrogenase [Verrucomicrobiota bacterium]